MRNSIGSGIKQAMNTQTVLVIITVIKLEEIEKISSLHTQHTANPQQHINNPHTFTLLHRLQYAKWGDKKAPEIHLFGNFYPYKRGCKSVSIC